MPHYHFNVHDGVSMPDLEGLDFTDLAAAKREAVTLAGDLNPKSLEDHDWRIDVTDGTGLILYSLTVVATSSPATYRG
jgi:hypothetical protein